MNSRRSPKRVAITGAAALAAAATIAMSTDGSAATALATEVRHLHADFNGHGYADLAVGVPFEDQAATNDGAVNVIYGASTGGLGVSGNEVWSQGSQGITGTPEAGDQFGTAIATRRP